ncbi:MAG: electron transfer flavoprotein subunit beta/FixA family protein [Acidobacteriia bacterium]|nr:electron transfer flavoprotein subunit beta/FixA family protein [Terriglobia bacterium]
MKILVGIKHVPDTEAKVRVAADGVSLDEAGVKMVPSPFDEYALEEALRIREARGGEVVVVCAGKASAQASLRQGLAMGADRAVLIQDDRLDRADGLARARALAAVARAEAPDLILLGKYGVGTDEGQTGPMLAEILDLPHTSAVTSLTLGDRMFGARREIEGAVEVVEGSLPAVISCEKGLNEPRYPSLKGIMAAKKKPLDLKAPADLGLDPDDLVPGRRVAWEALALPPARKGGRVLDGDVATSARELARLLREEAKVI